jgi:hypothetical protein
MTADFSLMDLFPSHALLRCSPNQALIHSKVDLYCQPARGLEWVLLRVCCTLSRSTSQVCHPRSFLPPLARCWPLSWQVEATLLCNSGASIH